MASILISGASGLLGTHAIALMHTTYEIHALVRALPKHPVKNVHYHLCDFTAGWDASALPSTIDAVFHLAQSPFMREYPEMAAEIKAVNADSTALLLKYAVRAGASRFVLASTGGLYAPSSNPLTEVSPTHIAEGPLSYYFQTKYQSEHMLSAYRNDFHCITLRPFFMYGAGQTAKMLIPRLMHCVKNGVPITLQGEHGMECNPIHAKDAALALAATLNLSTSRTYNIAGPERLSMRAIGASIGEVLGTAPVFTQTSGESPCMVADTEQMRRDLSAPQISFKDGIASMCEESEQVLEKNNV